MRPEQKLPSNKTSTSSKEEPLEFLLQDWSSIECHIRQIWEKEVFIMVKAGAYKIYNCNNSLMWQPVHQLSQTQEEAETKVFWAAKFAQAIGCRDAVIFAVDSDVTVSACF